MQERRRWDLCKSICPNGPDAAQPGLGLSRCICDVPKGIFRAAVLPAGTPGGPAWPDASQETMANWCIYCAEHYLLPLYEKLHSLLLKRDVLHADETTCQVLHEKGRAAESASYMWIFLAGSDGLAPIVLYDYQPSRRGACARDFLEGFHGLLQCDGNQGYNKVEDVALVCCLAHCRREFYEAVPAQRRKNIKLLDILSEETIPEPILP